MKIRKILLGDIAFRVFLVFAALCFYCLFSDSITAGLTFMFVGYACAFWLERIFKKKTNKAKVAE